MYKIYYYTVFHCRGCFLLTILYLLTIRIWLKLKKKILTVLLGRHKVGQMVVQRGVLSLGLKACPWGGAVRDLLSFASWSFSLSFVGCCATDARLYKKRNALFDVVPHVLEKTKKINALFDVVPHVVPHVLDFTKKKMF